MPTKYLCVIIESLQCSRRGKTAIAALLTGLVWSESSHVVWKRWVICILLILPFHVLLAFHYHFCRIHRHWRGAMTTFWTREAQSQVVFFSIGESRIRGLNIPQTWFNSHPQWLLPLLQNDPGVFRDHCSVLTDTWICTLRMSKERSPKLETISEEYPHAESRESDPDLNGILQPGPGWLTETPGRGKLPGSLLPGRQCS